MLNIESLSFAVDFSQRVEERREYRALAQHPMAKANSAFTH
jgi:hypothetical protein